MTQRSSPVCDVAAAGPEPPGRQARGEARATRFSKTLFGYVVRGLAVNCLVTFLILEAVQGVIFTIRATEGYSFDILIIFPVLIRAFALALTYTLPLSLLFGTSLLVGRLCADREILALRSFGVSPLQAAFPAAALGLAVTGLSWVLNTQWAPSLRFANRNAEALILNNLGYLGEGWNFTLPTSQFNLYVRHYDGPQVEDLFAAIGDKGKSFLFSEDISKKVRAPSYSQYLYARRGYVLRARGERLGRPVIALEDVSLFVDGDFIQEAAKKLKGPVPSTPSPVPTSAAPPPPDAAASSNFLQRIHFDSLTWVLSMEVKDKTLKDMTSGELAEETSRREERLARASKSQDEKAIRDATISHAHTLTELHRRVSLSLSALSFALTAFLLGLWVSSSNRLVPFFLASTLLPGLYFSGELVGNNLAKAGIAPWATQQIGNGALLAVCAFLLWRLHAGPGRARKRRGPALR